VVLSAVKGASNDYYYYYQPGRAGPARPPAGAETTTGFITNGNGSGNGAAAPPSPEPVDEIFPTATPAPTDGSERD
jgi:hypothetical protein